VGYVMAWYFGGNIIMGLNQEFIKKVKILEDVSNNYNNL
jgi:hypothetical protein